MILYTAGSTSAISIYGSTQSTREGVISPRPECLDPNNCDLITVRYTVPVLWDKKQETIVNNESAEIIRILNGGFNDYTSGPGKELDLYPEDLRPEIDELNDWVYNTVNSGCEFPSLIRAR
jgi:hypothetical protein